MKTHMTLPGHEDGSTIITDSNAILVYLARKYAPDFLPTDIVLEAEVQRFLSVAAGEIAFGPAAARLVTVFGAMLDAENAIALAHKSSAKIKAYLKGLTWPVGDKPTIADIALYSYTKNAPEGNVSMADYPNIRKLLNNVSELKGLLQWVKQRLGCLQSKPFPRALRPRAIAVWRPISLLLFRRSQSQ